MDLQTAAKRYEEGRNFWAREIALKLSRGYYRNHVAVLRHLAAHALLPARVAVKVLQQQYANPHSRDASTSQLFRSLREAGLVTYTKKGSHTSLYMITELGSLVLSYIPDSQYESGQEKPPDSQYESGRIKRGRRRKTPALA